MTQVLTDDLIARLRRRAKETGDELFSEAVATIQLQRAAISRLEIDLDEARRTITDRDWRTNP